MTVDPDTLQPEAFRELSGYAALPLSETRRGEVQARVEAARRAFRRLAVLDLQGVEPAVGLTGPVA